MDTIWMRNKHEANNKQKRNKHWRKICRIWEVSISFGGWNKNSPSFCYGKPCPGTSAGGPHSLLTSKPALCDTKALLSHLVCSKTLAADEPCTWSGYSSRLFVAHSLSRRKVVEHKHPFDWLEPLKRPVMHKKKNSNILWFNEKNITQTTMRNNLELIVSFKVKDSISSV